MEPEELTVVQHEGESNESFAWRKYVSVLANDRRLDEWSKKREKAISLNPNGFWESFFVSGKGLQRYPRSYSVIDEFERREKPTFIKVVSQALGQSDPTIVNKVVYMLRDPMAIADSQKNLFREWKIFDPNDLRTLDVWQDVVVKSPKSYITATLSAAGWFARNPNVPVLFVDSDKLISNPVETLRGVADFLGEGDFSEASKLINPSLVRSISDDPDILKDPFTDDSLKLHTMFLSQDWESIKAWAMDPNRRINREMRSWICARAMHPVNEFICEDCVKGRSVKTTLDMMGRARMQGIDWENRPCGYLSAYKINGPLVSIEDTISNNHWKDFDRFRVENYLRTGGGVDAQEQN